MKRWAHVYLPSSYDGSKTFPLWVHLHGVFWNTMDNISGKVRMYKGGLEALAVAGRLVDSSYVAYTTLRQRVLHGWTNCVEKQREHHGQHLWQGEGSFAAAAVAGKLCR
jgi:hypothetical protein